MPKLDKNILNAIRKAVEKEGSQAALCKKTGISTSIMSRYMKNEVETINLGNWNLLIPVIAPYLPEHYRFTFPPISEKEIEKAKEHSKAVSDALRLHNNIRENMDIDKYFQEDPLFLSSEEKRNTIKTLTSKVAYLTQEQVDTLLTMTMAWIKEAQTKKSQLS